MEQKRPYEQITCKLSPESMDRLRELCARKQLKPYTMLQMMCDTVIRYMDDQHNLTPEVEEAMMMFEHLEGWAGALNWAGTDEDKQIGEATYYMTGEGKQGVRAVHVYRPFCGNWTADQNVQTILERTFCLLFPSLYKQMRQVAVERGCTSTYQLICRMILEAQSEASAAELRRPFENNELSDAGRRQWEQRYKKHDHRDIERTPGLFDLKEGGDDAQ